MKCRKASLIFCFVIALLMILSVIIYCVVMQDALMLIALIFVPFTFLVYSFVYGHADTIARAIEGNIDGYSAVATAIESKNQPKQSKKDKPDASSKTAN